MSSYAIIKIVNMMLKTSAPKLGNFDIISNLMHIVTNLLPVSLIFLFRYVGSIYYYFITFILFICVAMCIIKNNNQKYNILLLVLLIGSCVLVPFIPNIFMNSNGNYTDARMALTLGTIPVILIIYLIVNYKISTRMLAVIGIMCGLFAMLTFYSVNKSMKTDLKRYEEDIKYIDTVKSSIKNYEENSNITINTIYYAPDLWQAYYYEFGNSNSSNIRLLAVDWAFECAMKAYINREIKIEKMPYDKYQEYFNNQEYGEFSNEELVYDNDKLYLLLYW